MPAWALRGARCLASTARAKSSSRGGATARPPRPWRRIDGAAADDGEPQRLSAVLDQGLARLSEMHGEPIEQLAARGLVDVAERAHRRPGEGLDAIGAAHQLVEDPRARLERVLDRRLLPDGDLRALRAGDDANAHRVGERPARRHERPLHRAARGRVDDGGADRGLPDSRSAAPKPETSSSAESASTRASATRRCCISGGRSLKASTSSRGTPR